MDINSRMSGQVRLIVGVAIAVVFFIIDFYPKMSEIFKLKGTIRSVQMAVTPLSEEEKSRRSQALKEEQRRLKTGSAYIRQVSEAVVGKIAQEENTPLVTLQIEDLAKHNDIELESIRPLQTLERGGYVFLPIEIGFQSEFKQLVEFLSSVESAETLMTVQQLQVSKNEALYPKLSVRLTIKVLFMAGASSPAG